MKHFFRLCLGVLQFCEIIFIFLSQVHQVFICVFLRSTFFLVEIIISFLPFSIEVSLGAHFVFGIESLVFGSGSIILILEHFTRLS